MEVKVLGIGLVLAALLAVLMALAGCANPIDAPETRCFTTPHLYCSQLADGDGD